KDLREIRGVLLRRDGDKEARRGPAGEHGGTLDGFMSFENFSDFPADAPSLQQRRRFRQLDVNEKLVALGRREELRTEEDCQPKAEQEDAVSYANRAERAAQRRLQETLVFRQDSDEQLIDRFEKKERAQFTASFHALLSPQQIIGEQRNEGHGNDARRDERQRDDNGQS